MFNFKEIILTNIGKWSTEGFWRGHRRMKRGMRGPRLPTALQNLKKSN